MGHWEYPGARWWKFDFHTHTRASEDFMSEDSEEAIAKFTPEHWLRRFMEKGIDCVAITDHNSGAWIDNLQGKLDELREKRPQWFRQLYLFPGVEISASRDVHLLAILGSDKTESDIDQLLGAIGFRGGTEAVATDSASKIIEEITRRDGIAIPAHVDRKKGLLRLQGGDLLPWFDNENIYAMELWDEDYTKPQLYTDKKLNWVEVRGSDTHFNITSTSNSKKDRFGDFTWVKMDWPTIEGLKLALIDGTASINRNMNANPNHHADFFIEELDVDEAKYIGRSGTLSCPFSPFLTTIIGGRGSGKSTLLEFMRLALRRQEEILPSLKKESEKYFNVGNENLLIENSQISLIYRKGDVRFRLNWSARADKPSIEESCNGEWVAAPGEIRSLFPAYIYSQKQIFELARKPSALLDIIDEAPDVKYATFEKQRKELTNRYKQIEQKIRELSDKISQENRLQGESNDLARQIEQIEKSGHREVLQSFRRRQQQLNEIDSLESKWQDTSQQLCKLRDVVVPAQFDAQHFDGYEDILQSIEEANTKWWSIGKGLGDLVQKAQGIIADWQVVRESATWMQLLKTDMEQYERLRIKLAQQGINPDEYPDLLIQQRSLWRELQQLSEYRTSRRELEIEKQEVFGQIETLRHDLSERRSEFLTDVLRDSTSLVNIDIKNFGQDWDDVEEEIRSILQCGSRFIRDFDHLEDIYRTEGDRKVEELKETISRIRSGEARARDGRFARHLRSLPQESMSELNLWFPGDNLRITFGPKNQPIEQGSPGQKTAALLAFILSYGSEPLLLDQPEDDLDNELIYELIVQQLRESKSRRQIIVVTHNANIVVNGDAEMVLPLKVAGGETHVPQAASIQDRQVRQTICDILEGGQQAFEQRYRRIHLEN